MQKAVNFLYIKITSRAEAKQTGDGEETKKNSKSERKKERAKKRKMEREKKKHIQGQECTSGVSNEWSTMHQWCYFINKRSGKEMIRKTQNCRMSYYKPSTNTLLVVGMELTWL